MYFYPVERRYTLGDFLRGSEVGTSSFVCTREDACCRDNKQAGTNKEVIGSFLCVSGDSLQEQCIGCDIKNIGHFVPAS